MNIHQLEISSIYSNTKNAVLIEFTIPENLQKNFEFIAGQHLTLDFDLERNNYRRTYSICNAPHEHKLCICVKRQQNGIISNYINNAFFKGFKVNVSEPFGDFFLEEQLHQTTNIVLWAGGSGITPMMSIAKHILKNMPEKKVLLVYANTNRENILFESEILQLKLEYDTQFSNIQFLSNTAIDKNILKKIFDKKKAEVAWQGHRGYITKEFITEIVLENPTATHYICGPEKMMELCENILQNNNVNKIYIERFVGSSFINNSNKNAVLNLSFNNKGYQVKVSEYNLLDAMLAQKINVPYACKMGTCGTCKATLKSGEVVMVRDFALNEIDREAGKILCCQTWAISDEISIEF